MSDPSGIVEHVFEDESDPAVLLQRVGSAVRAEACAAAMRLVAIADLVALRLAEDGGDTSGWVVDATDAVTLEVSAVLRCSRKLAASHVHYAYSLRYQLPELGKRFVAGDIDEYVFRACVFRTGLIVDDEVLARIDARLAERAPRWGVMCRSELAGRIDKIVARVDLDAVRRRADRLAGREVTVGDVDNGLAELNATLFSADAHAAADRLTALANTVCEADPRTLAQRRADAFAALTVGADRMSCRCGSADCPAVGTVASAVVIHVIAEQATIDGTGDAPAVLPGHEGLVPPEMIAELAKDARIRPLIHPGAAGPEAGYRPSRALAEFVRCRDVTCRFPGCDVPAFRTDIDHTIPYAVGGPTCASNLKCLCRFHHLAKTFWGWTDQQHPNGTVVWISPAGQRYVTTPGSSAILPGLCVPTAPVMPTRPVDDAHADRSVMMPRRRRTRSQQRAADITAERRANHQARTNPTPRWRPEEDFDLAEVEAIMLNQEPNPPPF
jgi:hypothetical protein